MTEAERLKGEKAIRDEILVTMLLPTYNRAHLLSRAVHSALSQTHKAIEVLICDDGSTDETHALMRDMQDHYPAGRLRYFKVEHFGSPARALNAGVRQSRGAWIGWLPDDDEWSEDRVEAHLRLVNVFPDYQATYCAMYRPLKDKPGSILHGKTPYEGQQGDLFDAFLKYGSPVPLIARRSLWTQFMMSEDPRLKGVEDYHLWLNIARVAKIGYAGGYVLSYPTPGSLSETYNSNISAYCKALAVMYKDLGLKKKSRQMRSPIRRLWRRVNSHLKVNY